MIAVLPSFVILGPLAILASLLPAIFGGLAIVMRRWLVLLSVAGLCSTLHFLHGWFHGYLKDSWTGTAQAMWVAYGFIALAGLALSLARGLRIDSRTGEEAPVGSHKTEFALLLLASLAGILFVITGVIRGNTFLRPWKDLLVVWAVAWSGLTFVAIRSRLARIGALREGVTSEAIMLGTLLLGSFGMTAWQSSGGDSVSRGVSKLWTFEAVERGAILSSPCVDGDRVYFTAAHASARALHGAIYCLDRHRGGLIWQFDDGGRMQQVLSSPCVADGRLYFGEGFHEDQGSKLYCLDSQTGKKLWSHRTSSHTESNPLVWAGRIYFAAGDDGIYCLNAATGEEVWHYPAPLHIDASPLVVDGKLYCGSGVSRIRKETRIFCLDAVHGKVLWSQKTLLPVWGRPGIQDGCLYFSLGNGKLDRPVEPPEQPAGGLLCASAESGNELWSVWLSDAALAGPVVDQDCVYVTSRNHQCYCFDRRGGNLRWQQNLGSPMAAAPALLDGMLYVASTRGRVACLSADTGTVKWAYELANDTGLSPQMYSTPVAIADVNSNQTRVYFGTALDNSIATAACAYCLTFKH